MLKAYSIFHIPPNGVEVTNGEVVSVSNSDGQDAHNAVAVVANGALTGFELQSATTCFVDQNDQIVIKTSNGGATLATSPAAVIAGQIDSIRLGGNYAVFNSGGASIDVNQFDGSGSFAANYSIAANVATFTLANAVTRIAVNLGPVTIVDGRGKAAGATVAINQGAWQNFPLSNAADSIMSTGDGVEIQINSGSAGVGGTFNFDSNIPKARLPPNAAIIANGIGLQVPVTGTYTDTITAQVDATGNITGFVLS